jgi:hypothetical protein
LVILIACGHRSGYGINDSGTGISDRRSLGRQTRIEGVRVPELELREVEVAPIRSARFVGLATIF